MPMFQPFEASEPAQEKGKDFPREQAPRKALQSDSSQSVVLREINQRRDEEARRPQYVSAEQQKEEASQKIKRVLERTETGFIGGRYVVPESAMERSQRLLNGRMDEEKMNLNVDQLETVKKVEQAILAGDMYTLQTLVKRGKPDQVAVDTISKDLKLVGMEFDWSERSIRIRSEHDNNHPAFRINVGSDRSRSNASLEWSTLDSKLGEPIRMKIRGGNIERPDDALWEVALTAHARLARGQVK